MPLPILQLPPDQASYAFTPSASSVATQLDGGASRFRADQLGAAIVLTVQWTLNAFNFDYLMAFYRTAITYGSDPFTISLILDSDAPQAYTAHFMPGTFNLISQSGNTYIVGGTIEAIPNSAYASGDAAIIAAGPQN
jgi:hypothetical protein